MEQLLDGLFRVLDPRAVLAIILLRFELLQEAEARRSGRVPGSAVLCHAETLLAAVRHLITNANSAAHFLHPRAATGAKLHGGERIALISKRREASKAASGDRAWGKFLHSRDVPRTATEPMTAKDITSGVLAVTTSTCGHCDRRLQIPERERDASNPFGLYVYAFACTSNRVTGRAL